MSDLEQHIIGGQTIPKDRTVVEIRDDYALATLGQCGRYAMMSHDMRPYCLIRGLYASVPSVQAEIRAWNMVYRDKLLQIVTVEHDTEYAHLVKYPHKAVKILVEMVDELSRPSGALPRGVYMLWAQNKRMRRRPNMSCPRCGHKWVSRSKSPSKCPKCARVLNPYDPMRRKNSRLRKDIAKKAAKNDV